MPSAAQCRAKGARLETVAIDVADAATHGLLHDTAHEAFGGFDTWVNNAGVGSRRCGVEAGDGPREGADLGACAALRVAGDRVSSARAAAAPDLAACYPVHAAAAALGDRVLVVGGGVPCLAFGPVFGGSFFVG